DVCDLSFLCSVTSCCFDINLSIFCCLLCFFFFQAEDGIRDLTVTGVQTCALPICAGEGDQTRRGQRGLNLRDRVLAAHEAAHRRSEERRVGKECRSRGSPDHEKKKKKKKKKSESKKHNNNKKKIKEV